jgi:hypothetical protein
MIELSNENALDERQAARYLGVSHSTLRLWRSQNRSPRYFKAGKLIRFRVRDLNEWTEARMSAPAVIEARRALQVPLLGPGSLARPSILSSGFRFLAIIVHVEITFDPRKSERNRRERELGFEQAEAFDFAAASYFNEVRNGERRLVAVGYLGRRLHILCFLPKIGGVRVISFRKANDREARKYGKPKTIDE